MSYNLRCDTPDDGELRWPYRERAVRAVWQRVDADLVGIQEGLPHQVEDLNKWFPEYDSVGSGRDPDRKGEAVSIFFKREMWTCLEHGDFWLSDTPSVPGSRSFGNILPRHATWARFEKTGCERWFMLNTHLDHRSQESKEKGATLIRQFLTDTLREDERLVMTGDFNSRPESPVLQILLADNFLVDVFAQGGLTAPTVHAYTGKGTNRIDYVFAKPDVQVRKVEVVEDRPFDLFPSDHFPIYADIGYSRTSR